MEKKPISGTGGGTTPSGQPVAPRKTSPLYQGRQASPPVVREREGEEGGRERREGEEGEREGGREGGKEGGREKGGREKGGREGGKGGRERGREICVHVHAVYRETKKGKGSNIIVMFIEELRTERQREGTQRYKIAINHQQQPLYYIKRVTFQPVNAVNLKSFTIGFYSMIPCRESALNYTLYIYSALDMFSNT